MTELITGVDLVEQMIRVAAGEPLAFHAGSDLAIHGWAIESRIYAEDPYRKFLPSIGRLARYAAAGGRRAAAAVTVRNDTGVREGDEISTFYDPMIAKLCAWAPKRDAAIAGMGRELWKTSISRVLGHNTPFPVGGDGPAALRVRATFPPTISPTSFPTGFTACPPAPWQTRRDHRGGQRHASDPGHPRARRIGNGLTSMLARSHPLDRHRQAGVRRRGAC